MLFMETPKQHFDSEDGDFKVCVLFICAVGVGPLHHART
jgi:hypothetical protein